MARLADLWTFVGLASVLFSTLADGNPVAAANGKPEGTLVSTNQGKLSGADHDGVVSFLGIPYAAPPTGSLRLRDPAKPARWSGVRASTKYGPNCPQPETPGGFGPWTPEYIITGPLAEDCLYLNIWTPAKKSTNNLPVFFWIHGGGFMSGSGSVPVYQGDNLAKQGLVVVTINYRLGALGFLTDSRITEGNETPGNFGIKDAIAALKWVRDNIASFGGDPTRVTIAGQSAGSAAVHALLASPAAKGLFVAAIAESGSGVGFGPQSLATAQHTGEEFAKSLVADPKDLRSISVAKFVPPIQTAPTGSAGAAPLLRFGPTVDGTIISDDPSLGSDVPTLTGLVADEGSSMNPNYRRATPDSLSADAQRLYGSDGAAYLKLYPTSDETPAVRVGPSMARDRGLAGLWLWSVKRTTAHKTPVYAYLFDHVEPGANSELYGAFHSSEIPYVFGKLDVGHRPFTDQDRRVSKTMMQYWANFAKNGDPNGSGLQNWPRLLSDDPTVLEIGPTVTAMPLLDATRRDFYKRESAKGIQPALF